MNINSINYKILDVEYDAVIIFDMLSKEERDKDGISEKIENLIKKNNYLSELFYLKNIDDLFLNLNKILINV